MSEVGPVAFILSVACGPSLRALRKKSRRMPGCAVTPAAAPRAAAAAPACRSGRGEPAASSVPKSAFLCKPAFAMPPLASPRRAATPAGRRPVTRSMTTLEAQV